MTYEAGEGLCPFCGAYSTRKCEFEGIEDGAECPWEIALEFEEAIVDYKREDVLEQGEKP